MKKAYSFLTLIILGATVSFGTVSAFDFLKDSGLDKTRAGAGYEAGQQLDPANIIGQVISILLGFIGVIFLGLMIYGGFTWMMSRGNQSEVDKAKKMIESAVIGLIIVLAAYAITYFVGQALAPSS